MKLQIISKLSKLCVFVRYVPVIYIPLDKNALLPLSNTTSIIYRYFKKSNIFSISIHRFGKFKRFDAELIVGLLYENHALFRNRIWRQILMHEQSAHPKHVVLRLEISPDIFWDIIFETMFKMKQLLKENIAHPGCYTQIGFTSNSI